MMHPESSLNGRLCVVTGGGRGIGAATAQALVDRGAMVFLCSRTAAEVQSTVAAIAAPLAGPATANERIRGMALDLTAANAAKTLFDHAEQAFGRPVSVLINNAGIGYGVDLLATSDDEIVEHWDKTFAVNARAPFLLTRELFKRFQSRTASGAGDDFGGAVVNLGSLGGVRSTDKFPGLAIYVASKFAIAGLTEALAVEGRRLGVRVNAVAPGAVDTEMLRRAAPHLKTETTPADIARVIVGLCDPSIAKAVTGAVIEVHFQSMNPAPEYGW